MKNASDYKINLACVSRSIMKIVFS